jgi:L-fucose isomerase-like protein
VGTDDQTGAVRAYTGEGAFTDDPLTTFGHRAVVEVSDLQQLMRYICRNGFEHHVAMNASHRAGALHEAFTNYLGWETYLHNGHAC